MLNPESPEVLDDLREIDESTHFGAIGREVPEQEDDESEDGDPIPTDPEYLKMMLGFDPDEVE